jgi:hypothetical protein
VELVVAKGIGNVQNGNNSTGKPKSKAYKIQDAVGFVAPKVTQGDFDKVSVHCFWFLVIVFLANSQGFTSSKTLTIFLFIP